MSTEVVTLHITKTNFLVWYFEDGMDDENEDIHISLANRVVNALKLKGEFKISVQDIFNEANHDAISLDTTVEHKDTAHQWATLETWYTDKNIKYNLILID